MRNTRVDIAFHPGTYLTRNVLFFTNADKEGEEQLSVFQIPLQAGTVAVRTGGISVGVIADDAPIGFVQGHKMSTDSESPVPPVKKQAHLGLFHQLVKPGPADTPPDTVPSLPEKHRRAPETGAGVSVNQGQLPLIIVDEGFRGFRLPQQLQGIIGGDPTAAGGRTGPEAVAPFFPGNFGLVIDQIHGSYLWIGCSARYRSRVCPASNTIRAQGRVL